MKIGNNTSILSIVTVLCVMVSAPLCAASSVRALGGTGTYNGASSAASAKASGVENTARAGSLRVGGATGGTRTSSTRGASAPRLSIGKYLGGASVLNGGSSLRPGQSGGTGGGAVSGDNGKLQERVDALEQFVGFSETGNSLKLDVESLRADLDAITGKVTEVSYKDGFLTIVQNGETVTDVELATAADLQAAIDSIVIPSLDGYAKTIDVEQMLGSAGFITTEQLVKAQEEIKALQSVSEKMNAAIEKLQGGTLVGEELQNKVADLQAADVALRAAIDDLKTKVPSDGSFATEEFVNALAGQLRAVDSNLESAIKEIENSKVDSSAFDSAIDALNNSVATLGQADTRLDGLILAMDQKFENVATKEDLENLRSEIDGITAGDVDLTNYYTIAQADQKFATKTDVSELAETVASNTQAATDAQNMANLNAADIKELQDAGYITDAALAPYAKSADFATVATTGSYKSLIDKPTIPSSISELAGADVLVNQDDLLDLRTDLEDKISKKQQAGEYITAEALRVVSDELAALKADSYTKAEIDKKITDAVTNGQVSLDGYATTAALTEMETALTALIDKKVNADALGDLAYKDMSELEIDASQIKSLDGSVIKPGTVTADKLDTGDVSTGEMAMLIVGADGAHNWVSVTVDK
ncbi:MAG: hypothetical protein IJE79_03810 [Alphaproteobacteria bacterium]|nr:hypothetical protein [Alphaproteobacteria bacterium]